MEGHAVQHSIGLNHVRLGQIGCGTLHGPSMPLELGLMQNIVAIFELNPFTLRRSCWTVLHFYSKFLSMQWYILRQIKIWTNLILCIKIRFSPRVFCYVKLLQGSCRPDMFLSLMRAFKWGTALNFSPMDTWNTKGQAFTLLKIYLIKGHFLGTFDFDLWWFWYPLR